MGGLLLSIGDTDCLDDLFEAWSVGLLSASAPWRMVCALTAAGILNIYPSAIHRTVERIATLKRYFRRFESTIARRIWAERAAVPVCSRYIQSLLELLSAIKKSGFEFSPLSVDAATPLPLPDRNGHWEWEEGWAQSDEGWDLCTGTVKTLAVDWKIPGRSPVRTLMDGGEGPPMVRKGCLVMRGLDWDDPNSGVMTKNEDGKDLYEKEKALRDDKKVQL